MRHAKKSTESSLRYIIASKFRVDERSVLHWKVKTEIS